MDSSTKRRILKSGLCQLEDTLNDVAYTEQVRPICFFFFSMVFPWFFQEQVDEQMTGSISKDDFLAAAQRLGLTETTGVELAFSFAQLLEGLGQLFRGFCC